MLRDPNRPRGNPLFDEVDSTSFDATAPRARHPLLSAVPPAETEEKSEPRDTETEDRPAGGADVGALGAGALLDALVDAGPETAEHLLRAMHELLLAAQTVVAAAERGLDQRGAPAEGRHAPASDSSDAGGSPSGRVRHIDLD